MNTATPWLCGLAVIVLLNIVLLLFNRPASRRFGLPLMLAAYVIVVVLFSKLGVWAALALWCGIGLLIGLSLEFRSARHTRDAEVQRPSLVTLVQGLFAWPITVPLKLLVAFAGVVVEGGCTLVFSIHKKLLPNHVPHYGRIERCREAALSGDAQARFTLGCGYESGEYGLSQDYVESVKWFRKAAEQNHHAAQLRLGIYLAEGKGVEKNPVEGLMWILLSKYVSTEQGAGYLFRDAANQASTRAKAEMTEQQIAQAWVMLDSSPLYQEFKERESLDLAAFEPAPEQPPPAQPWPTEAGK